MSFRTSSVPATRLAFSVFALVALVAAASAQSVPAAPDQGGARRPAAASRPRAAATVPAAPAGEQIYRQRCASCHGARGEGTAKYAKPLVGTRSAGQLAPFIQKSMPPGAAKKLTAAEAGAVAGFVHESFYSPVAQARNRPARVELAHLTVRQYRNALADLIGSFRSQPAPAKEQEHGLRGQYYKAGRQRFSDRTLERVDPEIRFDFGTKGPLPEQDDPYQFSMQWEGSVIPPDTGEYEIVVRTEHAARLFVNDLRRPLIDALVKSGSDNEYRQPIFLLGGRPYSLRLEFSKGVQGVNDLAKLKQKPPQPAALSLSWLPPKRTEEVIPARCLVPQVYPESFAVAVPFPPDDRSLGYERGTAVSKEWDEATTEGALQTAAYVLGHLRELSGVPDDASDRAPRLREFCRTFAERAFRRPLTPELQARYVDRQFEQATDPELAVKRVVLLVLKSPRFLYPELGAAPAGSAASTAPDPYDVAARLSFGMWDSIPDAELLKAAAAGELSTRDQVRRQAERMTADPRAWAKLREFFLQWLKVDQYPDLAKDAKRFPGFDAAVAADLRTSLELTLEHVVWGDRSDFRNLWLSDQLYLNGRLAKFYGLGLPADAPFQLVTLDPGERSGLLTHPYLLASLAYVDTSSPIHRGVLIARNLLGRMLQPPPQAFTPLPASMHPGLTTRQRVALQTKPAACAGCHDLINPLGFTLEKFDAVGKLRTVENDRPVDSSGSYAGRTGPPVRFSGARQLSTFLASSEEARDAFVEKLFQYVTKQPVRAFGPQALPDLERAFAASDFSIRKQLVESVALTALKRS